MSYPTSHETRAIMQPLHAGDDAMFQYVQQFYPALCYFSGRLTGNDEAAEEIATEAVSAFWQSRRQFTRLDQVTCFLYDHARKGSLAFVKNWQRGIKDDQVWTQIWKETETYVQHEMIRAEVLRHLYHQKYHHASLPPAVLPAQSDSNP